MLSNKVASSYLSRLRQAFDRIGTTNGTTVPPTKRNTDSLAWELYRATELERYAKQRKDAAAKACIDAGLMFDHKENPLPAGTEQTIYDGEIVQITVKVNNAAPRFNSSKLKAEMIRNKISSEIADKVYQACLVDGSPAHTFRAVPIVGADKE